MTGAGAEQRTLRRARVRPERVRLRRPVQITERPGEAVEMVLGAVVIIARAKWPVHADQGPPRGRGIPAGGVAPPANTPGILGRRALPSGRRAPRSGPSSPWTGH